MTSLTERLAASRARVLATLRRTRSTLQDIVEQNERLRELLTHRESAERRIAEGHEELARLDAEIDAVEHGEPPPTA